MDHDQQRQLLPIIRKIRMFQGLSVNEVSRILRVSGVQTYRSGADVFQEGGPSTEMLVLLKGEFSVLSRSGTVLGEILPGTSTGESPAPGRRADRGTPQKGEFAQGGGPGRVSGSGFRVPGGMTVTVRVRSGLSA